MKKRCKSCIHSSTESMSTLSLMSCKLDHKIEDKDLELGSHLESEQTISQTDYENARLACTSFEVSKYA